MARTIGRRPLFFAGLAVLSILLDYPTPAEFRWVCWFCAGLAAFWAVALALEELTGPMESGLPSKRDAAWGGRGPESPVAPPPPPGGSAGP